MVQIAKNRRIEKFDVPVLGLAGCHFRKLKLQKMDWKKQVRRADQSLYPIHARNREKFTCVQMVHTHAPQQRGFFGRCISESGDCVCFHKKSKGTEKCKNGEIGSDVIMCSHQQDHQEFPDSLDGFEPKYLT